jgi:hypothetical protein
LGRTQETKRLAEYVTNMADDLSIFINANEEIAEMLSMKLKGLSIERYIWERFYAQMITALRLLHMMNVRFSLLNMAQRILGVTLPNF